MMLIVVTELPSSDGQSLFNQSTCFLFEAIPCKQFKHLSPLYLPFLSFHFLLIPPLWVPFSSVLINILVYVSRFLFPAINDAIASTLNFHRQSKCVTIWLLCIVIVSKIELCKFCIKVLMNSHIKKKKHKFQCMAFIMSVLTL